MCLGEYKIREVRTERVSRKDIRLSGCGRVLPSDRVADVQEVPQKGCPSSQVGCPGYRSPRRMLNFFSAQLPTAG